MRETRGNEVGKTYMIEMRGRGSVSSINWRGFEFSPFFFFGLLREIFPVANIFLVCYGKESADAEELLFLLRLSCAEANICVDCGLPSHSRSKIPLLATEIVSVANFRSNLAGFWTVCYGKFCRSKWVSFLLRQRAPVANFASTLISRSKLP